MRTTDLDEADPVVVFDADRPESQSAHAIPANVERVEGRSRV